jgi:hypothetical protein
MLVEHGLHDAPLDALAAAMNQANLTQTGLVRRIHVFFDDRWDVAGVERVKVDRVFDGNVVGDVEAPLSDVRTCERVNVRTCDVRRATC